MSSSALPAPPVIRDRSRSRISADGAAQAHTPTFSPSTSPAIPQRRSSGLSFASLDGRRHSVASTANDFIFPALGDADEDRNDEPSHWHSTPLAFAILPALGGLFFTNGSAFITDALLLGLAAIFLNWSVRLPWDWYRRAQSVYPVSLPSSSPAIDDDDSISPDVTDEPDMVKNTHTANEAQAAQQLRTHEIFALLSTFLFPPLAAYLLHVIRGQLSRPSTGLVSDYNLTIFLLAAEIRPFRHLVKLITNRTLHLQRLVNADTLAKNVGRENDGDLATRVEQLEAKLAQQLSGPTTASGTQKDELTALSNELKKRYEPRIDALERALRRYEKRVTTLTILTEQRLQNLQSKLDDALSLAAVAAQSTQKQSILSGMLAWMTLAVAVPVQALLALVMTPIIIAQDAGRRTIEVLFGPSALTRSMARPDKGKPPSDAKSIGGKRLKSDKLGRAERSDKSEAERKRFKD